MPKNIETCQHLSIFQAYLPDGTRIRIQEDQTTLEVFYFTNRKEKKGNFSYSETESQISREEFSSLLETAITGIGKMRYLYKSPDSLLWEIDWFPLLNITVAEVELESEEQEI